LSVKRHTPPQAHGSIINGQVLRQTADGTPPLDSSFERQWPHAPSTPHLTCQSSESTLNLPGVTSITEPLERGISPLWNRQPKVYFFLNNIQYYCSNAGVL